MNRAFSNLALAVLVCGAAHAATINTTMTVKGSGALFGTTFTGTADLTGIGTGLSLTGTFSTSQTGSYSAVFVISVNSTDKINVTLTIPPLIITGSATATGQITGGTGAYSGAAGSFPSMPGTGTIAGTSLSLTFSGAGTIVTGGTTGPATPAIETVQNNFGLISPGLPNYGLAPSTLFFVRGTNLSNTTTALLSSADPGLQTTVNGVTVTVTAGSTTLQCPLYYVLPTQVAAVLPGATPLGNATITVTNNGATSAAFPIVVVQSAFGILSYNGSLAAAYDSNYAIITASDAANPNQVIALWGSGVGYDPADDDRLYPQKQDNLTNIPMQAYVGGVEAAIAYRGRSQFPGLDQVVLTIPGSAPTGCYVSLSIVSGNIVSNSVTIPIAASGRTCSDSNSAVTPDLVQSLSAKSAIKVGFLTVSQTTTGANKENTVGGLFGSVTGISGIQGFTPVSIGSCLVSVASIGSLPSITGLDAGSSISVNGPAGSLTLSPLLGGVYSPSSTVPATFIPSSGGVFTFDNGAGGKDVQHFNTTLTLPAAFTWSNAATIASVSRAQGVNVTWTGGAPGSYVNINGSSTATISGKSTTVSFTCLAPQSAGQFTVPVPVLLALPAGTGSLSVGNYTNQQLFTAPGLDLGLLSGSNETSKAPLTYN